MLSHAAMDAGSHSHVLILTLVVFCSEDVYGSQLWNMPKPVLGYEDYFSLKPSRYHIPDGLDVLNFTFHVMKSKPDCPQRLITFAIERGGLPLVKQTDKSFPTTFLAPDSGLRFQIYSGILFSFSLFYPLPGSWYVVAYHNDVDDAIRQEGLTGEECKYTYLSQLGLNEPPPSTQTLDFSTDVQQQIYFGLNDTNVVREKLVIVSEDPYVYSFQVPRSTSGYRVVVDSCEPQDCNITLATLQPQSLMQQFVTKVCEGDNNNNNNNGTEEEALCTLSVESPSLSSLQKIYISSQLTNQTVEFHVELTGCSEISAHVSTNETGEREPNCVALNPLDRIQPYRPFNAMYGYVEEKTKSISFDFDPTIAPFIVIPFDIHEPNDIGATLKMRMRPVNFTDPLVMVCGLLMHDRLPGMPDSDSVPVCSHNISGSFLKNFTSASTDDLVMYVPYPQAGLWHVIVAVVCFADVDTRLSSCESAVQMEASMEVTPCVDKECSGKGSCLINQLDNPDLILYTGCRCDAGYQGYACTDDTHALPVSLQLAGAYLLTMSNLFFIPAIFFASRRGFIVEAFVYFYNMFFSTFYHACDGERLVKYSLCIMQYEVMQTADFFGSACSLWVTVVAMARIPHEQINFLLQIAGAFGIFIGVIYDKHSLSLIAVPMLAGLVMIIGSWGIRMYKRRKLYPSARRYLLYLLPGVVLAATGASLFAFLETKQNYKYIHSFWHVCLSSCICFLLPPRKAAYNDGRNRSETNMRTHLLTSLPQPTDTLTNTPTDTLTNTQGHADAVSSYSVHSKQSGTAGTTGNHHIDNNIH